MPTAAPPVPATLPFSDALARTPQPRSIPARLVGSPGLTWCLAAVPYAVAVIASLSRIRSGHNFGNLFDFIDASRAMLAHQDLYSSGKGGYVYPPLIAFLYQPLAGMPDKLAATLMLAIEAVIGLITLVMISRVLVHRLLDSDDRLLIARVALIGSILTADKIKGEFGHLETNFLMLLAYTTAMRWVDRRPWLCGLALGFAFNIKYLPVVLLPWLLLRRRWQASLWFATWAVGFAVLPAVSMGWGGDCHAWGEATGGIGRLVGLKITTIAVAHVRLIVDSVSISATSGLARVTHLPPSVTELLAAVIAALLAAFTLNLYRRAGLPPRWPGCDRQQGRPFRALFTTEWLGLLLLMLALSPFTNSRHLYMLLDVNIAAAVLLLGTAGRVPRLPLAIVTLLLWLGITFPPGGTHFFDGADNFWRTVGGPGWCMLAMFVALIWTNARRALAIDDRGQADFFPASAVASAAVPFAEHRARTPVLST